jgi:transcriptional regulator with XRE-family HTH domain
MRMTTDIGRRIAHYRKQRGITAQALADRCAELGMPIGRGIISKLESGIREHISLPELLVIARALSMAPVQLMVPVGLEDNTEILPGRSARTWDVAMWITGERDYPGYADQDPAGVTYIGPQPEMGLFRQHETLLSEWHAASYALPKIQESEADFWFDPDGLPVTEDGLKRAIALVRASLPAIRVQIRERGLVPPPLPRGLADLEQEGAAS